MSAPPSQRAAAIAAMIAALVSGCASSTFGDYPRGAIVVAPVDAPAGWMHVEEPGWFAASTPGAPKTTYETISVLDSRVQVKALSASDERGIYTWIRYFEVSSLTTMLDPDTLMRAGRDDFTSIRGVRFLRDEPRAPGGPTLDFVCTVAPRSPLDLSDAPMIARVRAYEHRGGTARVIFAIAVWPADTSDEAARAFFEAFQVKG